MSVDPRNGRIARTGEPGELGAPGAERWSDYLDWLRADVVHGVLDMHAGERRVARVPSAWSPIELLSHVLHMEQRWFVWGFLGEPVRNPWGDWTTDPRDVPAERDAPVEARWQVPDGMTAERLAERIEAVAERTRHLLRTHALTDRAAVGGRFSDHPPTLEWICFHVTAEYARHAGHLDIVAELGRAAAQAPRTD